MRRLAIYLIVAALALAAIVASYGISRYTRQSYTNTQATTPRVNAATPAPALIPVSDGFDYPVGRARGVTEARDGDGWYNAQDFGVNNHLGEDWNGDGGGNTDCGQPVFSVSKGTIFFAGEAGPGWGKIVLVRHRLPDGTLVETLYGHLGSLTKTSGDVARREQIGSVGDADGSYPCHLHFELRFSDCPFWGATGPGYGAANSGWTDPSVFIAARRNLSDR